MVVLRVGAGWRAVQSFCPHLGGPLFQGTRSGDELTCPWHRWRFSLVSGARTDLPGATDHILVLPVELDSRGTLVVLGPRAGGDANLPRT
jgi:nitrite reductase (NADH) small subunit/3-phenylpropionate/trans-cinnamate dioxygenase ferredoxin subunit